MAELTSTTRMREAIPDMPLAYRADRTLLALDLGTTTGWALHGCDGLITSGTVSFRPGRFDGGGMRYLRFTNWLGELDRLSGPIATIWFEEVRRHAGTDIAMAGDEIVMPENAFLMIHDPAGVVMGTAIDMRAMAEALDKIKGSLLQGYAAKSGRPQEEIAPLMAAETWLDAKDALDLGFADRIAEPVRIAARFDVGRFRNAPPVMVEGAGEGAQNEPSGNEAAGVDDVPEESASDDDAEGAAGNDVSLNVDRPAAEPDPPPDPVAPPLAPDAARAVPIVDAATMRADVLAHARAVVDICRLAGQPQMAGRFLERDAGLDEVRAALLALRAETEPDISAAHPQPGRPSGARPWGDVIARTFRLKG